MKLRCIECEYFAINPNKMDEGQCRRYTPKVFTLINNSGKVDFISIFPQVPITAGCGEGSPKFETTN